MDNFRYTKSPTAYSDELRKKGQRSKARAFWEYVYDVEDKEENSIRFYAKSWGVSKTTADRWMDDFKEKYELFVAAMELYNMQHNKSAKKDGGHNRDSSYIKNHSQTTCTPTEFKTVGTEEGQHKYKALNQYDDNNARVYDKLFIDLFNIYNMNSDFPGSKEKAKEPYMKMCHTVQHKDLIRSTILYLHDPKREGKLNNLANFLKNEVYINYMPKYIRVFTNDVWMQGEYDRENETFTSTEGDQMKVLSEVFTSKFIKGEIEFIREIAA